MCEVGRSTTGFTSHIALSASNWMYDMRIPMTHASRRLERLFYLLISAIVLFVLPAHAAEPNKTVIADTIYRADGTPARGTILISWPAFSSADGKPVAAGTL